MQYAHVQVELQVVHDDMKAPPAPLGSPVAAYKFHLRR